MRRLRRIREACLLASIAHRAEQMSQQLCIRAGAGMWAVRLEQGCAEDPVGPEAAQQTRHGVQHGGGADVCPVHPAAAARQQRLAPQPQVHPPPGHSVHHPDFPGKI